MSVHTVVRELFLKEFEREIETAIREIEGGIPPAVELVRYGKIIFFKDKMKQEFHWKGKLVVDVECALSSDRETFTCTSTHHYKKSGSEGGQEKEE